MPFGIGRSREEVPAEVRAAARVADAGRLLSAAPDADSRVWVVATMYALALVDLGRPAGETLAWVRPWHEIDAGSWGRESPTLTLTFVDRSRPVQIRFGDGTLERTFLQTLRERVQASVVLAEELKLRGRRTGRAVIRQDLRTSALLEQVVLGRGVVSDDEVAAASEAALAWLREQVGKPAPEGQEPTDRG